MAIAHHSPLPTEIDDPVTYKEAVALLRRTGHHAPETTLRRWVREEELRVVRSGRTDYLSWSDLLEVHGRRTAAKLRAGSNWP